MAILGRSQPLPAIISRSDPADFATTKNPVTTVVVAPPYARIWFKGPSATLSRSDPADFVTTSNPNALVYTPLSKPQLVTPAIIVENPQAQVAPVFTATPAPLVYVPANPQPKFTLPLIERSSLADPVVAASTPQPLVITPPQRQGLTPPSILLSRANPANLIITPVPPPVVYAPIVPRAWRGGRAIVWFPRGAFEPPPPPGDIDVCAFGPIITWYASPPVIGWVAGEPVAGWVALEPEEDC